jgi:two-component system LytT family response regulator
MMTCIIVDDEPAALGMMKKLIAAEAPFLQLLGTASTIEEAKTLLASVKPDVAFLDVMLGSHTSFELLETLDAVDFEIIFTTSHESFALKAFDYKSIHYLIKPIDTNTFKKAMTKLQSRTSKSLDQRSLINVLEMQKKLERKLVIANRQGVEFIPQNQIAYLKSNGSYTEVYLLNGEKKIMSKRMGVVAENLSDLLFLKVHKKYMVNLEEVAYLESGNAPALYLKNGEHISVASTYRTELLERLQN